MIQLYGLLDPQRALEGGKAGRVREGRLGNRGGEEMKPWPKYPVIYEINTWVWLSELEPEIPEAGESRHGAAGGVGCHCLSWL